MSSMETWSSGGSVGACSREYLLIYRAPPPLYKQCFENLFLIVFPALTWWPSEELFGASSWPARGLGQVLPVVPPVVWPICSLPQSRFACVQGFSLFLGDWEHVVVVEASQPSSRMHDEYRDAECRLVFK